jgi:hypothetical protein
MVGLESGERALRWLVVVLGSLFAAVAIFAAVVMPYRLWDSLAFGSWSRSIAETGDPWVNSDALSLQRPLFYVSQGLAWRVFGDDEWIGRVLSLSFVLVLAVAVWMLAGRIAADDRGRAILPALAVCTLLASSLVATYAASGMTDVPVAALVAVTAVALWSVRPGPVYPALVALCAAAAVLAKPTALLGFAGLAVAVVAFERRRRIAAVAGLGAGIGAALAYSVWQAERLGVEVVDFLQAGNDDFWRERGAAARWDALARAEWLGAGLRLVVVFGIAHAIARVAGAQARVALAVAGVTAVLWSVLGPVVADDALAYPFTGSVLGIVAWIALAAAMTVAPILATDDLVSRRGYATLLVWLVPTAVVWLWQRADETRHLAPVWAPLVLLAATGIAALSVALARARPVAAVVPAAALAVLVLANLPSIDGLGRNGWRDLLDLGPSRWSDRAEMENFAYGPFSYELNLARENVAEGERIVSNNGRLAYFFPGRVEFSYPGACTDVEGARFFSFLVSGESLEFARLQGQPTDPLGWLQCEQPRMQLVGEHPGIYAAFVVGEPARPSRPEDCQIRAAPGELVDAIFGDDLPYREADSLRARALAVGFEGTRIERTGCSTFRVLVTGVPDDPAVQDDFRRQAASVGFVVAYAPASRFPEAPPGVPPVPEG